MTHTSTEQERQAPIKIHPGDDLHLTVLMASHGLNFVTGKDREQLLAWGRDVWQAARRTPAVPVPHGWKLVPVELLKRIQESLGSFVSDQGWSQSDMDTADALNGLLARDLIEDTDLDDEAFDDFAEDVDESECHNCSGTGEGMYDSQSCVVCLGKGFL